MFNARDSHEPREANLRHFAQFVREHEPNILTYVYRLVGNKDDAEDLTQEALLQAYRTWNQVDPDESIRFKRPRSLPGVVHFGLHHHHSFLLIFSRFKRLS